MAIDNLMKKVNIFSRKVKAASNVATVLFLLSMAFFIGKWHKVSSFDSFINALMTFIMLFINIRLYKIYLQLNTISDLKEDSQIQRIYVFQKKEYSQLVIISLMIIAVLIVLKLMLG